MNKVQDLYRLLRPAHWLKSAFVFTGIVFGKKYGDSALFFQVVLTALAFSFISSSTYILNDLCDAKNDKHHPQKKLRPLASGKVSSLAALFLCIATCLSGLAIGYSVSLKVFAILIVYLILNLAYSWRLKQVVILDVFCIASGFMLRILSGTIGVGIPPSKWLLLCGLMITLFIGFAKRSAELLALRDRKTDHRLVLENYSSVILDEISAICASGVIISYSLYTMSDETIEVHHTPNLIYTVPFVIYGLFRYIFLLHHCQAGGDPTYDLIKDPHIVASVSIWASLTFYLIM